LPDSPLGALVDFMIIHIRPPARDVLALLSSFLSILSSNVGTAIVFEMRRIEQNTNEFSRGMRAINVRRNGALIDHRRKTMDQSPTLKTFKFLLRRRTRTRGLN
jgi:hypothetical protein